MTSYIYIIKHKHSDNAYVGSTDNFNSRYRSHERRSNFGTDGQKRLYGFIRDNGGFYDFDMDIICKCSKEDRYKIEQHYIDTLQPTLNTDRACSKKRMRK